MSQIMNRMANTVVKAKEDEDRKIEQKIARYEELKEERLKAEEQKRQVKLKKNNEEIRKALYMQVEEKKKIKFEEAKMNDDFMRIWMEDGEKFAKAKQ